MKRWLIVTLGVLAVLAAGFLVVRSFVISTSSWAKTLRWEEPDLALVADGSYEGTTTLEMPHGTAAANRTATVRVTVKDHRYEAIEVLRPEPIASGMTRWAQAVIEQQSLRPEAISGATVTKSVVLMAAAKALTE